MQGDSEELLRLFIDQAPVPIAMFDGEMRYIAASRRWVTDYGLGQRGWRGTSHYEMFPDIPDRWRAIHERALNGEVIAASDDRFDRADGTVLYLRWEVRPWYREEEQGGILIFAEDVTERKKSEDRILQLNAELEQRVQERTAQLEETIGQLQHALTEAEGLRKELREQAIRDPLTGLFNRRFLEESMNHEVARARRGNSGLGVIMLDMDKFKLLNDTYGHESGDAVLRRVALLLLENVRASDVACRFGGDEFIILMPGASLDAAMRKARQLGELLKAQGLDSSTGVATYPEHGSSGTELLRSVDAALYRARKGYRGGKVGAGGSMSNHVRTVLALALTSAVLGLSLRADGHVQRDSASKWAGEYYLRWPNSTASYGLVISPEGHFTLTEYGCFSSSEADHGRVAYRDGVLLLNSSLPGEMGREFMRKALIPVHRDGVLYLVDVDRIENFANAGKPGSGECTIYCSSFFGLESDQARVEARWTAKKRLRRGY